MKLHGLIWWIDRWRKSTAYTDLSLEEQAAYRNLLDEAWLRGGPLPDNDRILAKACGDATRWQMVKRNVLKRFTKQDGVWRNETLDTVLTATVELKTVRSAMGKRGMAVRWGHSKPDNKPDSKPYSKPDSKPDNQGVNQTIRSGSGSGSDQYVRTISFACPHDPRCPDRNHCTLLKRRKAGL